jgi:branched-chain amino acid transport system substrate-binding protein
MPTGGLLLREGSALRRHRGLRNRAFILLGLSALSVAMVACGSSSKNSGTATTTTPSSNNSSAATAAPATGTPIKIGLLGTFSGTSAAGEVAAAKDVYQAWVSTVNASGGIDGHPIDLITLDDAANPGTSVDDLRTLLSDHVVAIADSSLVDQAWEAMVQAADIPVVGYNNTETPFDQNPDFYPAGETIQSTAYALVAATKTAGATNFGVLYCAEAVQCAQYVPLYRSASQKVGLPLLYTASISAAAPNYTAQCLAAQEAHITALLINDSVATTEQVAANCHQQGYNPLYVEEGDATDPTVTSAPGLSQNTLLIFGEYPYFSTSPIVQRMNAAVDKYDPGLRASTTRGWSGYAENGWVGGLLMEAAINAGGLTPSATPTSSEIISGLDALNGNDLSGWTSPLTFTSGQTHPDNCWFTAVVKSGATGVNDNGQPTCEPQSNG